MKRLYFIKKIRKCNLIFGVMTLLLLSLVVQLTAQEWNMESLTRGKVWLTVMNSFQLGQYIDDVSRFGIDYPGYSTGAELSDHLGFMQHGGYIMYGERDGMGESYTITSRQYTSPQYTSPTEDATLINNYNMADPSLLAEEIVTGAFHVININVDVKHKSIVWSYPKYDDFVIHELTITNTGSTPLTNFYLGLRLIIRITMKGGSVGSRADDKYGWDSEREIFYFYDDQSFNWETEDPIVYNFGPGPQRGDIGDAANILVGGAVSEELLSAGYYTAICLDPGVGNIYQNICYYHGKRFASEAPEEDRVYFVEDVPPSTFLKLITHDQPRMSWDEAKAAGGEGGNKWERQPEFYVSCGPLAIAAGASETVVFAQVLGEMDRAKIVAGGVDNIDLLATESKAALLANVDACKELYDNGYEIINHPPPTPSDGENSLELTTIGGGIRIAWPQIPDNYTDPKTGIDDFAGYKVYQSTYFCTGPWTEVANIPKESTDMEAGQIFYEDTGLSLGVGYYYTVTTYDTDGNECGKVNSNRFPVYPLRAANTEFPNKVYVVPNPFRQHSGLKGKGEELRMEFIGLPSKCTIDIYTLTGDLVKSIEHDDGSGAESWGSVEKLDYQVNRWMFYIAPGVYVYRVESKVSGQKGKTYIGKFAIIK